jgi:hypothetical protein
MTGSQIRQIVYVALALVGLFGTFYFNMQWGSGPFEHTAEGFVRGSFGNSASSSVTVDLTITYFAASVWMITDGRRLGMRRPWLYAIGGLVTAIAFTFPLFLAMRERNLDAATPQA